MNSPSSAKTPNRWLVWILTAVISLAVVAFFISKRLWVERTMNVLIERRAAEMGDTLKAGGAKVGEPHVADKSGDAEQAVELDVNGHKVRLLEFDLQKESEAKEVQHVHQDHTTKALGAEQPAEDEGPIVIVDFEQHPDKAKILDAFHKSAGAGK